MALVCHAYQDTDNENHSTVISFTPFCHVHGKIKHFDRPSKFVLWGQGNNLSESRMGERGEKKWEKFKGDEILY